MSNHAKLPWWLKPANRIIIALYRLGWAFGTWYVLSVPGRKTGKLRSTPVSVLVVDGRRYIVTGFEPNWVKNARAVLGVSHPRQQEGTRSTRRTAGPGWPSHPT